MSGRSGTLVTLGGSQVTVVTAVTEVTLEWSQLSTPRTWMRRTNQLHSASIATFPGLNQKIQTSRYNDLIQMGQNKLRSSQDGSPSKYDKSIDETDKIAGNFRHLLKSLMTYMDHYNGSTDDEDR